MDDPAANKATRLADTMLIVMFVVAISVPFLDMVFHFDKTPNAELRTLSPTPNFAFDAQALKQLPMQVKDWMGDHFGLRNFMIRQHGMIKARWLGVSSNTQVVMGKQDSNASEPLAGQWLFYATRNTMNYNLHRRPMSAEQLEIWRKNLTRRQQWLRERGARYIFVIAPNSQTIYPEFLPDSMQGVTDRTRADDLIEHLRKTTDIEVIDLRQAVMAAKRANPDERLFMRTDTHWNDLGSFRAYEYLAQRLKVHYPAMEPLKLEQFDVVRTTTNGGDLAGLLGGRDLFLEDRIDLVPRPPFQLRVARDRHMESKINAFAPEPDNIRLVMFRDSFAEAIMSYLAEHCSKSFFQWTDRFEEEAILREKPNLVITQMVERLLWRDVTEDEWMVEAKR